MRLKPYTKQAIKWCMISLPLFVITVVLSQVAWAQMSAGSSYALAFVLLMVIGLMALIAAGVSVYFAIITID